MHGQRNIVIIQWLLRVLFGAVVFKLLVWCGAEGYVSGLQDAAASCKLPGNQSGGLQVRSGQKRETASPPGVDSRTFHPVSSRGAVSTNFSIFSKSVITVDNLFVVCETTLNIEPFT